MAVEPLRIPDDAHNTMLSKPVIGVNAGACIGRAPSPRLTDSLSLLY
jgi:hypothetical protein